jgi:hypothetical protein
MMGSMVGGHEEMLGQIKLELEAHRGMDAKTPGCNGQSQSAGQL